MSLFFAAAGCGDDVGSVNKLTAENGVTAEGTFEKDFELKTERYAADSEQGKAAVAAIWAGKRLSMANLPITTCAKKKDTILGAKKTDLLTANVA